MVYDRSIQVKVEDKSMSTKEKQEYDFKAIEDKWRDYWRENGFFTAKVSTLVKVTELLNAKLGSNKKMESIKVTSKL